MPEGDLPVGDAEHGDDRLAGAVAHVTRPAREGERRRHVVSARLLPDDLGPARQRGVEGERVGLGGEGGALPVLDHDGVLCEQLRGGLVVPAVDRLAPAVDDRLGILRLRAAAARGGNGQDADEQGKCGEAAHRPDYTRGRWTRRSRPSSARSRRSPGRWPRPRSRRTRPPGTATTRSRRR